jgi:hypothetical protein
MKYCLVVINCLMLFFLHQGHAQSSELRQDHLIWKSQSLNAGESMPCGGGDVGLNVWVEKGELLFYISRSGTFDENNTLLKLGRVRIKLSPNPFEGKDFKQELSLQTGAVLIEGKHAGIQGHIKIWVDVFNPVIHLLLYKPVMKIGDSKTASPPERKTTKALGNGQKTLVSKLLLTMLIFTRTELNFTITTLKKQFLTPPWYMRD